MIHKTKLKDYAINLNDYEVIRDINTGQFGVVKLVKHKTDHGIYAAKVTKTNENIKFLSREISILIHSQAPTIIPFKGYSKTDFHGNDLITFLMEYKDKTLKSLIDDEEKSNSPHDYDNTAKQIILCGVAHGMMYLHSRGIIHRDLKPDNVLIGPDYSPFITDFGLSKFLDPDNLITQSINNCGTPAFMAPEVSLSCKYDSKADVYSFGVLMYEVLKGENINIPIGKTISDQIIFNASIPPRFQELIERCLDTDPRKRPTFRELFNKLSLSLDFDDELIEEKLTDELSTPCGTEEDQDEDEDQDEEGDYRYCLPGVDHERVLDYVSDITSASSTSDDEELYQTIESQNKRINQLEKHNQSIKERLEEIEKKHQEEINYLKQCLIDIQNQLKTQKSTEEGGQLSNTLEEFMKDNQDKFLTKITIPSSVTSLGNFSFREFAELSEIEVDSGNPNYASIDGILFCKDFRTIVRYPINKDGDSYTIPSTVTSIASDAFAHCSNLKSITIPSSVTTIEDHPFSSCTLEKIFVDNNNPIYVSHDDILFTKDFCNIISYPMNKKGDSYTIPSTVTSIYPDAFAYCSRLTDITVPSSVTTICDGAFYACTSLLQLSIPSSVVTIGKNAFGNCVKINEIIIPSSVTSIGSYAFAGCIHLNEITIPSSVIEIGSAPFSKCLQLQAVFVEANNPKYVSVDDILFTKDLRTIIYYPNGKTENEYSIPSSVTSIGESAFTFCTSLSQITIPLSVESIGNYAFSDCSSLTQITIPPLITSIGNYVFYKCSSLTQITIPSSVTSIGNYAFSQCSLLTQITIPSSVTSIRDGAFSNCTSLTQITIPSSVTSIGNSAFSDCSSLTQITIPSSVISIGNSAFSECSSLTQITIPSSVTSIGNSAFSDCSSLTQITIPSSVTSIGNGAFSNCSSLTQFAIPSSVTSIRDGTFYHCDLLTQITIPSSVTSIGDYAFSTCSSLTQITIPSSVTSIGDYAFFHCSSLPQITIPSSVTSIGNHAFQCCPFVPKRKRRT